MSLTTKHKNRRQFFKKLSVSAAAVALAPNILFGKTTQNNTISIGFSNTPPEKIIKFGKFFSQNPAFIVKGSHLKTDIHYIHAGLDNELKKSGKELYTNTILIVNRQNLSTNSLADLHSFCCTNKIFLLMIEENLHESAQVIFSKATLYEPYLCNTTNIEKIVKSINFLSQLTQNNHFFTINQTLTLNNTII